MVPFIPVVGVIVKLMEVNVFAPILVPPGCGVGEVVVVVFGNLRSELTAKEVEGLLKSSKVFFALKQLSKLNKNR
jgi:hypothetical protein